MWGGVSSFLPVSVGVGQGCILALAFFNTCMTWTLGRVVGQSNCGVSVGSTRVTDLFFVNDSIILAGSRGPGDGSQDTAQGGETFRT